MQSLKYLFNSLPICLMEIFFNPIMKFLVVTIIVNEHKNGKHCVRTKSLILLTRTIPVEFRLLNN